MVLAAILTGVGIYAWFNGDFNRLITPYDSDGKGCGKDHPGYPYIYFASPHSSTLWVTVCVKVCPKASDTELICVPNSVVTSCQARYAIQKVNEVSIYDSKPVAGRVCVPTS